MFLILIILRWIFVIKNTTGLPYNQPTFSPCVSWNISAVTFSTWRETGFNIYDIYVDSYNTVYIMGSTNNTIFIWSENTSVPTMKISTGIVVPTTMFVDDRQNIYVAHKPTGYQVQRWSKNGTIVGETVWLIDEECFGLFIDIDQNLYCALRDRHHVIKKPFNSLLNSSVIIAGTSAAGSRSNMLIYPYGIFVDTNFSLYIADSGNNRIQLFRLNETNGTTLAGTGAPNTIPLNAPRDVILDGNGYLYIVDSFNDRIVASGPTGFRCIFGCLGSNVVSSQQLRDPVAISFDTYGNILVADRISHRVQKFLMASNHCLSQTVLTTQPAASDANVSMILTTPVSHSVNTETINGQPTSITTPDIPFNQPTFSSCTTWSLDAITFANMSMFSYLFQSLFIDKRNTIYAPVLRTSRIRIWFNGNSTDRNATDTSSALFVSNAGEIYMEDATNNGVIRKWSSNGLQSQIVAYIPTRCRGLFIDITNTLYCSLTSIHLVVKKSLDDNLTTTSVAVGTGASGNSPMQLNEPVGIFVDTRLRLYVADYKNNRIQLFLPGSLNGTTIAGRAGRYNITLNRPTFVVLDADDHLFIVDSYNHRIIYASPYSVRCIVGCSGINGSGSDQLNVPNSMSLDSFGNIYVADSMNDRIQKFSLATNSCETTASMITTRAISSSTSLASTDGVTSDLQKSSVGMIWTMSSTIGNIATTSNDVSSTSTSIVNPTIHQGTVSTSNPMSSTFSLTNQICPTCNISIGPCTLLNPCQNNGICFDNSTALLAYTCHCPPYFNGTNCQIDNRPCRTDTCRNNGTCIISSNTSFICHCTSDWEGINCERKVDYCTNVNCKNGGVCRPLIGSFQCECIDSSYSGQYCETTSSSLTMKKQCSRSVGYIAILFLVAVFVFLMTLDILKYFFNIDAPQKKIPQRRTRQIRKTHRYKYYW